MFIKKEKEHNKYLMEMTFGKLLSLQSALTKIKNTDKLSVLQDEMLNGLNDYIEKESKKV